MSGTQRRKQGICGDCGTGISTKKNKRCIKCNAIHRRNDKNIGRKEYVRNWHIQKKYNLSPSEFDAYWIVCKGKCFICEKYLKWPESKRGQDLDVVAVDHNHATDEVRGLLCNACNKALGFFDDNIYIMQNAIKYLGG